MSWPHSVVLPTCNRALGRNLSIASEVSVASVISLAPTELDSDASEVVPSITALAPTSDSPVAVFGVVAPPSVSTMAPNSEATPPSRSRSRSRAGLRVRSSGRLCCLPVVDTIGPTSTESHVPPRIRESLIAIPIGSSSSSVAVAPPSRIRSEGRRPPSPPVPRQVVPMQGPMSFTMGQEYVETIDEPGTTTSVLEPPDFDPDQPMPHIPMDVSDDVDECEFALGSYMPGTFDAAPEPIRNQPGAVFIRDLLVPEGGMHVFPGDVSSCLGSAMGIGAALRASICRVSSIRQGSTMRIDDDDGGLEEGWRHASARIGGIVRGGVVFYIGITEHPARRWSEHSAGSMWDDMEVLIEAPSSRATGELEERLLQRFSGAFLCQNASRGGERRSGGRPHYLYVLIGRSGLLRRH